VALEYCDSFNTYSASQIVRRYPSASSCDIGTPGPDGSTGQHIKAAGNTSGGFSVNVTARSEYYVGFDLRTDIVGHPPALITFRTASGTTICAISNDTGFTTTFGNSPTGLMAANTWYQIAIYIKRHPSAGVLTIKIDGVTVLNLTGLNTGSTDIGRIDFVMGVYSFTATSKIGNLWILNTTGSHSNTWPSGRMVVKALYPSANGTYTGLTPNSGSSHYNRVSDATADDDTSYNSGLSVGDKDSYAMTDLATSGIAHIHGMQVTAIIRKDDINSKNFQLFTKSGSTEAFSTDIAAGLLWASTTRDGTPQLLQTDDPNTGNEWAVTDVNALEAGVKITL
jgi:hypothetical protein